MFLSFYFFFIISLKISLFILKERRRQLAISKNTDLVKFEKQQQIMSSNAKKNKDAKMQLALLKEILYDDEQLKSLIHNTDSTLKTVKDFFLLDNQSANNNNHLKVSC